MKHSNPRPVDPAGRAVFLALAGFALGSCRAPYRDARPASNAAPSVSTTSIVDGETASNGLSMQVTAPNHELEPRDGSRMYLLDLYQKVKDEKEALVIEVKGMHAALEQEEGVRKSAEVERDALAMKLQAAEVREQDLQKELSELVARLTTAQIRRLEAEKLLLESKIEAHKSEGESASKLEPVAPAKDKKSSPASGHKP